MSELTVGDVVAERTYSISRDTLVRYAGASGDFNPIHYRDDVAKRVGLDGVLAHGMLTMGIAVQPVVEWLGATGRILDYQVRFTRPVPVDPEIGATVSVVAKVGVVDRRRRPHRPDRHGAGRGRCPEHGARQSAGAGDPGRVMTLADLTTLHVGGDATRIVAPATSADLIEAVQDTWADGDDWLILGGGSNVVIADDGFDGTVIRVVTRGVERLAPTTAAVRPSAYLGDRTVRLRVQAGEPWDDVVAQSVENGWAGIEALSGIPGSTGAAPIQNIGAYGQEISSSLVAIEFLDYLTGEVERLPATQLGLGYRTSLLKQGRAGLVIAVELELAESTPGHPSLSQPVAYAQLAATLGRADRRPRAARRSSADRARAAGV